MVLSMLLVMGVLPMTGYAESSEIWPGYPGVDQLPSINTIPDLFKFFDVKNDPNGDGYVTDPSEWTARRNEIKDLVQRYWLGYRWPTRGEDVTGETKVTMEPNVVYLGFHWPPYFMGVPCNPGDEFKNLSQKLLQGTVEIHELVSAGGSGSTTEGGVKFTFGPATTQEEAESQAIEAWNAGYYIPYSQWGSKNFAVLKNLTGTISAPPGTQKANSKNVVTIKNPDTDVTASFNISVTTPSGAQMEAAWGDAKARAPVVIDIGGAVSQVSTLTQQGYAYINFTPTDIYPDDSSAADGISRNGVYTKLYPYNKDDYEFASGALMAWGWGAGQIISALESPASTTGGAATWAEELQIDPAKTLVTGHSRYGKAALFAAAFDDRFSICLPSESGGSGIQSYRYKVEGKIFNFNVYPKADRVYGKTEIPTVSYGGGNSWFPETAANFVNKDNQLPFDSSDIISLVAPRPFFATTGIDAHWLGNEGAVAAVQAASEVYDYIGGNDVEKTNIAVRARESNHVLYNRDLAFVIAIMDREFKQSDDKTLHVKDLFPTGSGLGNVSYPAKDYSRVSDFNSYPFDINSSYLPWSSSNKYTLWTAQENFLVGYPVTITAHSNAPDVKLFLPNGTEISSTGREGEVFSFSLTAEQAVYGRYELRTVGPDKKTRSVFFAAVSLADSLRHATSKGDEGEENRLAGFSSRLANSAADAPEVFVNGKQRTMSFTPERFKTEETTLLEYGVQFHDKLFVDIANNGWDATRTFDIKNLKFVTIPGFTFEISFGNVPASAGNSGKDLASNFTQPISWNVERFNNGPAAEWPVIPDTQAERDTVMAGGTVTRPAAPAPKATAFDTKIVSKVVQHVGDKANVVINFDSELDTREFGFGFDVTDKWDTVWSEDKKTVTLSMDYSKFPVGSKADLIIFRLKDTEGNLIPGPIYLPLTYPDEVMVALAIEAIEDGTYQIPYTERTNQETKNAWVQGAVNARIPAGNGSTATVTHDNGYIVTVSKGSVTSPASITVTEQLSPVNALKSLTLSSGTLIPSFDGGTLKYNVTVPNSSARFNVTPVLEDLRATVKVNGISVASGDKSLDIALKVGFNTVKIVVAAENGTPKTYTLTVNRLAYDFKGFLSPIKADGSGSFKAGSVIPVKFQLKSIQGYTYSSARARVYIAKVTDGIAGDEKAAVASGFGYTGNLCRYDNYNMQYVFNLSTKGYTKGTWRIRIDVGDGLTHVVNINLK